MPPAMWFAPCAIAAVSAWDVTASVDWFTSDAFAAGIAAALRPCCC